MFKSSLIILLTFTAGSALADVERPCSRAVMDELNRIDAPYVDYFIQRENSSALQEIRALKPSSEFQREFADELVKLSEDDSYEPSASFCAAAYTEAEAIKQQMEQIAKRHEKE